MRIMEADIAVLGSGFAGSLTAWLLRRLGRSVVLVDRGSHPRFAIGESSTPVTNLILEQLAKRYDVPALAPLGNYGSWKRTYPQLDCGLKRGFSYFHHHWHEPFTPQADHGNELLVAASFGPDDADTHWLRADFDHWMFQQAVAAGAIPLEQTALTGLEAAGAGAGWRIEATQNGQPLMLQARFVIDGTGEAAWLARQLDLPRGEADLHTHSRCLFAHFRDVRLWQPYYEQRGGDTANTPFPADAAALHHVFDGGWMYVLRFDSGVTSAGFCLDAQRFPIDERLSPEDEWRLWMSRLPSVAEQFAEARPVSHGGRLVRTQRMQRHITRAAGGNWALLPATAGFIDPLHSTGNAHSLSGIERLIAIIERYWGTDELPSALAQYDQQLQIEIRHIDRIIAGSYAGFSRFRPMIDLSMFYFAAAIWSEAKRREHAHPLPAFVMATDERLAEALALAEQRVQDASQDEALQRDVYAAIAPINIAGLGDAARKNRYPYPKAAVPGPL